MKYLFKITIAATLMFTFNGQILAETPVLNERQANQKARIAQGIKSGELTKKETARMVRGQAQLQRMENRAKADGVVTKKEKARLQHKANKESAKIYRNKHDVQKRPKAR
ncbi:hypothetical protein FLL45_14270 [Aliikangiella marina]|uniref:DUF4148 domain-containing protein n=1 Tax=Aliikangiella marina TaxID=1712262 RepID=A0A545T9Y2_9GAMM|nr:hypothetical protein [Aliikangiella marina]TQV74021.1 hypothetical protein FLL45_14270 [Aliikangiella marina]